jgi:hypothetical protein
LLRQLPQIAGAVTAQAGEIEAADWRLLAPRRPHIVQQDAGHGN